MAQSWHDRVKEYVDELEAAAKQIDALLHKCRIDTENVQSDEVQSTMQRLTTQLAALENMVVKREELLESDEAPSRGHTLTEKLQTTRSSEDARLAKRCGDVAHLVADVNHRAISIFICQYHLAEFGNQLIRIVAGEEAKPTYKMDGGKEDHGRGGGLFNEAA